MPQGGSREPPPQPNAQGPVRSRSKRRREGKRAASFGEASYQEPPLVAEQPPLSAEPV